MSKKICGVYKITNLFNGKFYVGSSNNIHYRWKQHYADLRDGVHNNQHLQRAWNKYGENNFEFSIIEECDPSVQFEREQYYLNVLNPFDERGYNIIRKISSKYGSDNYTTKKCKYCGKEFKTFSHLAKKCDECKAKDAEDWNETRRCYLSNVASERDFNRLMVSIYGNMEYYCDITD